VKLWFIAGVVVLCGCAAQAPIPAPPDPPPASSIVITEGMVGKRVLIEFAVAPKKYTVSCCLPKGVKVVSQSGKLWLQGTPLQAGTFKFSVTPQ
jgi:hypothetical protein